MKKKSKGNFFNFIDDTATHSQLKKKMLHVIRTKGKGITPDAFLKEFHDLGYDGVSLRDCNRILITLKKVKDPSRTDWLY
jgi:hypothetical protein